MKKRLIAAATVTAVALAGAGLGASAYAEDPQDDAPELGLAEPTGASNVGVSTVHLTDDDRADPWVPEEKRQLMVSLWYPTDDDGGKAAPYMTKQESSLFIEQSGAQAPPEILNSVETNATVNAEPQSDGGELPLAVLSPGFSFPRATLSGLAEDLASRGYIVAAVGHNYEAPTTFPNGQTTKCLACAEEDYAKVVKGRVSDLSFVVDTVLGKRSRFNSIIDEDRILMGGHSIGGASSYSTMLADERVDAGFNLDGTFYALDEKDLDRPFLMLGAAGHGEPGGDKTWDSAWNNLTGWKRWISVNDTNHSSMTDLSLLQQQLGTPTPGLSGERCTTIARDYLSAFADTHLRGDNEPILDGPTQDNPEVVFHDP